MYIVLILSLFIFSAIESDEYVDSVNIGITTTAAIAAEDTYILRVRNEDYEYIANAWATLKVEEPYDNPLKKSPPVYYTFEPVGEGVYHLKLEESKLTGKNLQLSVHSEGYKGYSLTLQRLNKDVTVPLEKQ